MEVHKVSIMIFYKKDKILLQDRRVMSKMGEEWGFFGGHIEENESPEQALVREIEEELCYKLKRYKFFKKYNLSLYNNTLKLELYVYLAPLPLISKLKQIEGNDMKLFTIKEANKLKMVEGDNVVLNDLDDYFSI